MSGPHHREDIELLLALALMARVVPAQTQIETRREIVEAGRMKIFIEATVRIGAFAAGGRVDAGRVFVS